MKRYGKRFLAMGLALMMVLTLLAGCGAKKETSPYADPTNWAYCESDVEGKDADVFFINPVVYLGDEEHLSWSEYDDDTKAAFVGAINMEKGIYDADARFFAPLYHQAALSAYYLPAEEADPIFEAAYQEVKDAFIYYLEHYNNGRPIILAGFSQGADMSIRLLKDVFADEEVNKLLVACYAIGWRVTEEDLAAYPHIKMAQAEDDTGVIVCYTCEAEGIEDSIIVPQGTKSCSINPLNWKTDSTPADKALNRGAVYIDKYGEFQWEKPELTGAYISPERGTLITPDIDTAEFSGHGFPDGVYHLYDVEFFYRNLQENVLTRYNAWMEARAE